MRGKNAKKGPEVLLTLEDLVSAPWWKRLWFLVGWLGCGLAAVGFFGGLLAEWQWTGQVNGVLSAAMAPVAVLAASAFLVFGGGVERLFQDGRGVRSPYGVQVGLAVVYVGLTVAYFVAALAALSVPPGTPWRVWVVGVAYVLLGEVLGASFVMPWRLLRLEKEARGGGAGEGLEA